MYRNETSGTVQAGTSLEMILTHLTASADVSCHAIAPRPPGHDLQVRPPGIEPGTI